MRQAFAVGVMNPGATIVEVTPDSPAAQAGLQAEDTITAINGQPIEAGQSLAELIRQHAPGDTLTLTVERPGEQAREVTVTLAENPQRAGAPYLGVRFNQFPRMGGGFPGRVFPGQPQPEGAVPGQPGQPMERAIVIRQITENSPAAAAGLAPDDLITAINGEPVRGPRALVERVAQSQPGDTLTLTVTRAGEQESREVTITLAENPDQAGATYLGVLIGGVNIIRSENGVDILEDMNQNFMMPGMGFEMGPFGFNFETPQPGRSPQFDVAPFEFQFEQLPPDIIKVAPCLDPANCGNTI
jgi:PDZ domain-containing secreted protein